MAENDLTTRIREKLTAEVLIAFVLGVFLGLVVLGWWLWPVRWTNTDPADLRPNQKETYLQLIADSYALTGNTETAIARLKALKGPAEDDADLSDALANLAKARLAEGRTDEATRLEGLQSAAILPPPPAPKETPVGPAVPVAGQTQRVFIIVFFLVLLGAGVVLLLTQLQKRQTVRRRRPTSVDEPLARAATIGVTGVAPPLSETSLGHFETTYHLGDEGYDISYSIESSAGEFLGECGVSALEEVGLGEPGGVSALEIWLFDKEDVRTETKVLTSPRAFADDASREELASKGTLVQAEQSRVVAVETANLRLDATITDLEYEGGSDSVFSRLTTKLEISRR
jgi:hypothetical protein